MSKEMQKEAGGEPPAQKALNFFKIELPSQCNLV